MKIITIIPAYNEEKTIDNVVKNTLKHSDVIVIDDGSTDQTPIKAKEAGALVIKHDINLGKGAAIKTGIKKALEKEYKILVLMDGDGQHDPHYIPYLISGMDQTDVVIGSRFKEKNPKNMPLQRRFSNKLTTKIIEYVTGYNLTDSQSGFRCISNTAARIFTDIHYNDYIYESEVLYLASKNGIKISEKQISCNYEDEKSYITWKNILRYIFFVFRLLLQKFQNKYYYFSLKGTIKQKSRED